MSIQHPKIVTPSGVAIDDRRPAGGPLRIGDVVRLGFVSRVVWASGERAVQFMDVQVTARHRGGARHRGELIDRPNPQLFTCDEFRIGAPVAFRRDQCLILMPDPLVRQSGENPFLKEQ